MNAETLAQRTVARLAPPPDAEREARWAAWVEMLFACRPVFEGWAQNDFSLNWHTRLYETYRQRPDEKLAAAELREIEAIHAERALWQALSEYLDAQDEASAKACLERFFALRDKHPKQADKFIHVRLHRTYPEAASPEYQRYLAVFGLKQPR